MSSLGVIGQQITEKRRGAQFESVSQFNFKNGNQVERHFIRTTIMHPCGEAGAHYSFLCFSVVALK